MRLRWLLVVVVTLTLAAGCSKDAPPPAGPSLADLERAREEGRVEGMQTVQASGPVQPGPQAVEPTAAPRTVARVTRVVDGDTIEVNVGGRQSTVRYLGVDTPEGAGSCYADEASAKNSSMVDGQMVELEKDVSEADGTGRLLRYVYVDGFMVNEILVRDGFAKAVLSPPDLRQAERLLAAQHAALVARRGLWGACAS